MPDPPARPEPIAGPAASMLKRRPPDYYRAARLLSLGRPVCSPGSIALISALGRGQRLECSNTMFKIESFMFLSRKTGGEGERLVGGRIDAASSTKGGAV